MKIFNMFTIRKLQVLVVLELFPEGKKSLFLEHNYT